MASVDLPWDITTEILSRLPVKSLMRFKCVSISFYNLISNDPIFRKKHLYHQSKSFKKAIIVPQLFYTYDGGISVFPCPLISLSPKRDVIEDMIALELQILGELSVNNCCNGLFCMTMSKGDAVIWNPTTRQIRTFRSCRLSLPNLPNPRWIGYSLAHDSRSDVYKLLGLSIYGHNTYKLCFYSMETEMWRYIEESSPCEYVKYIGNTTIMNGAFHWLGSNEEQFRMPHVVVTLDISDETYGTLALPQGICNNLLDPILYELKGKLCIFSKDSKGLHWDLWVMNEYGDADSIIKMLRMSSAELPDKYPWPFDMLEDDTVVIYKPGHIYFYKDGKILNVKSFSRYWFCKNPFVYFESLVSPDTCLHGKEFNQKIVPNGFSATNNRGKDVETNKW
ncbi:hypothetical protein CASFOL_003549 [Castilleja foliolosa]|uniref:F-box domain-containing protein n=1 Tax=Castilleja foliolosa TaxID=1961234 RepID=A0ABD3EHT5_9LAMI